MGIFRGLCFAKVITALDSSRGCADVKVLALYLNALRIFLLFPGPMKNLNLSPSCVGDFITVHEGGRHQWHLIMVSWEYREDWRRGCPLNCSLGKSISVVGASKCMHCMNDCVRVLVVKNVRL